MFDGVIKMFNEIVNNQMFIVGFAIIVTLICIGIFYMILGFVIFTLPMLILLFYLTF